MLILYTYLASQVTISYNWIESIVNLSFLSFLLLQLYFEQYPNLRSYKRMVYCSN